MKLTAVEINRKLIHTSSAIIPLVYWFVVPQNIMIYGLVVVNLVFFLVEYLRLIDSPAGRFLSWFFKPAIREREASRVTGAAFVFLGNLVTITLFPKGIAVPALLILSISDSFAALIGIPLGKHRIGTKSLEGSLAFFLVSIAVLAFFPSISWIAKILGAALGTLVEAFLGMVDDNIAIPVSVAAILWLISIV